MTYGKAKQRFISFGSLCDDGNTNCDGNCDKCEETEKLIINALEAMDNLQSVKDDIDLLHWYHINYKGKMVKGADDFENVYVKFSDVVAVMKKHGLYEVKEYV